MRVECTEHSFHDMKTSYQTTTSEAWEPPGGVLVWLLVFLEVITFGAGIITFLAQGRDHAAEFAAEFPIHTPIHTTQPINFTLKDER